MSMSMSMGRIAAIGLAGLVALAVVAVLYWQLAGAGPVTSPLAAAPDDRALRLADDEIQARRRAADLPGEVAALHAYATLLKARQRVPEAGETYCAALRLAAAATDPAQREGLAATLHSIGDDLRNLINRELGQPPERRLDLDRAFAWYGHTHDAMAQAGQAAATAQVRHNMAALALDGERTPDALRWVDEAIDTRRRLLRGGEAPEFLGPLAWSLALKGHALYTLKRYDDAIETLDGALKVLAPAERTTLTEVGQKCIDTLALVATALVKDGRAEQALDLWRRGYALTLEASVAHRELWLHHAMRLHMEARDFAGARQATELLVQVNALRTPARRDVAATIWYDFGQLLLAQGGDLDLALESAERAADIQRDLGWDLALGWSWVLRGKIHLKRADGAAGPEARHAAAAQAQGEFEAARALFERCGEARDGLMAAYQGLRDAAAARGDKREAEIWQGRLDQLLKSPPPTPLPRASFDPADAVWNDAWDQAEPGAPVVSIIRDADESGSWIVVDVLDPDRAVKRLPFDWGWREVDVRHAKFALAGPMILANRWKLFRQRGEGAMFLRSGALVPWPVRLGATGLEPVLAGSPRPTGPPPEPPKKD